MDFSLPSSLIAGFLATVMMTLATELASLRGATSMPPIPLLIGALFSGDHDLAMALGSVFHYLLIGTIFNGAAYALVISLTGAGVVVAGSFGMVHGALFGAGLGWVKRFHPRVVDLRAPRRGDSWDSRGGGEVVFEDPGIFGVGWGDMTPAILVGAHVIYAVVFAFVYSGAV